MALHRRQSIEARTRDAPHGMMSFALAGDMLRAERIRSSWRPSTRQAARSNLRLDVLFSLAWTNAIALADTCAADELARRRWPGARLGDALAAGQWAAALLAATKDAALLAILRRRRDSWLASVARWAAILEIGVKGAGIVYAFGGVAAWLSHRWASRVRSSSLDRDVTTLR